MSTITANNEIYSYSYQFPEASIFHRQKYCIRYDRWQSCFLHPRFLAKSHQISSNNYSVHVTLVYHVKMEPALKPNCIVM